MLCPVCKQEESMIHVHFLSKLTNKNSLHRKWLEQFVDYVLEQNNPNFYQVIYQSPFKEFMLDGFNLPGIISNLFYLSTGYRIAITPGDTVNLKGHLDDNYKDLLSEVIHSVLTLRELDVYKSLNRLSFPCQTCNDGTTIGKTLIESCLCPSCRSKDFIPKIVTKEFKFAASHNLPNYDGLCRFLHGHEWKFQVSVYGFHNYRKGMFLDFSQLKKIVNQEIVYILDHNYLNNWIPNPTAENIIEWIWCRLDRFFPSLYKIRLWESPTSFVELTYDQIREGEMTDESL